MEMIAAWIRKYAVEERPFEVHFSDCENVTERAVKAMLDVASEGRCCPPCATWVADPKEAPPLWLQVGGNYIPPLYVNDLVRRGFACEASEACGTQHCGFNSFGRYPSIHLRNWDASKFAAKRGAPPPAPKFVA